MSFKINNNKGNPNNFQSKARRVNNRNAQHNHHYHKPRNAVPGPNYICHNCGIPGHYRRDCRNRRHKGQCPSSLLCKLCKTKGHWIEDCPQRIERIQKSIIGKKKKKKRHKTQNEKLLNDDENDYENIDLSYNPYINDSEQNRNNNSNSSSHHGHVNDNKSKRSKWRKKKVKKSKNKKKKSKQSRKRVLLRHDEDDEDIDIGINNNNNEYHHNDDKLVDDFIDTDDEDKNSLTFSGDMDGKHGKNDQKGGQGFHHTGAGGAGVVPFDDKTINIRSQSQEKDSLQGDKHRDESHMSYIYADEDSQHHKLPEYSVDGVPDYTRLPQLDEEPSSDRGSNHGHANPVNIDENGNGNKHSDLNNNNNNNSMTSDQNINGYNNNNDDESRSLNKDGNGNGHNYHNPDHDITEDL